MISKRAGKLPCHARRFVRRCGFFFFFLSFFSFHFRFKNIHREKNPGLVSGQLFFYFFIRHSKSSLFKWLVGSVFDLWSQPKHSQPIDLCCDDRPVSRCSSVGVSTLDGAKGDTMPPKEKEKEKYPLDNKMQRKKVG